MGLKTVVELDLVGYSDIARTLEQNVGVQIVANFNEQIQSFVDAGLIEVGIDRASVVRATTGDGAILLFDSPSAGHMFSVAVHEATRLHNDQRSVHSAKRRFRIGVATGAIAERRRATGGFEIAGTVIASAVRLEAACLPGQIVVDSTTFNSLPADLKVHYGSEELVNGKRDEVFSVRRYTVVPFEQPAEASKHLSTVLDLFERLNPRDQLNRIVLEIGMPEQFLPTGGPLYERQNLVVQWAKNNGSGGLSNLESVLRSLIVKQAPLR